MVSIIMPAYNSAETIGSALESVFAQTLRAFEVIVINDGSPDTQRLEQVLKPYLGRTVYHKQENRGPSAARNAGIRRARGEFLAFLDSDDEWYPEYLATQMSFFQRQPELDMVYSDLLYHGDSEFAGKSFMQVFPPKGRVTFENFLRNDFLIFPSSTVMRKRAVVDAGLFDEQFSRSEDFDLFLRIAHRRRKIVYHRKVLGRRLVHPGALSFSGARMAAAEEQVLTKLGQTLDLTPRQHRLLQRRIAMPHARQQANCGKSRLLAGDYTAARQSLQAACRLCPTIKLRLALLGLRVAPGLTRFSAGIWYKLLSASKSA